jgi:hypothetical protein
VSADRGACAGRAYLLRGELVVVERGWRGKGPRNVLVSWPDVMTARDWRACIGCGLALLGGALMLTDLWTRWRTP